MRPRSWPEARATFGTVSNNGVGARVRLRAKARAGGRPRVRARARAGLAQVGDGVAQVRSTTRGLWSTMLHLRRLAPLFSEFRSTFWLGLGLHSFRFQLGLRLAQSTSLALMDRA